MVADCTDLDNRNKTIITHAQRRGELENTSHRAIFTVNIALNIRNATQENNGSAHVNKELMKTDLDRRSSFRPLAS
jgi:hypothetical protein